MAVVHVKKRENPYVQIDKRVFEDPRLSWRAKGIMGYLLSKPNGWKVNVVDIWGKGKEGRNAVQDCMAELRLYGYADLVTTHDENGVFTGKEWVVSEEPKNGFTDTTEKPKMEEPKNRKSGFRSNSNNDLNSNNEEGEEAEKAPTPETYDEFMDRVNSEAAAIRAFNEAHFENIRAEAKKEKDSPISVAPSNEPSTSPNTRYMVATVEADTLPGHVVTAVEVVTVPGMQQPTNPDAAKALLSRMKVQPKADNEMDARKLIVEWCENHGEQVKWAYESAKRKQTPEDLNARIIDFSGHFATTDQSGKQLSFFNDPVFMFKNGLTKWLQRQNQFDREQSGSKFAQPTEQKSNLPKSIRRY